MFDVANAAKAALKAVPITVINACSVCEHRHPAGCHWCDLDQTKPEADPWWNREDVAEAKLNIASGEDVTC